MTLSDIVADVETDERTVTVYHDEAPPPMVRMLERMVEGPEVTVERADAPPDGPGDVAIVEGPAEENASGHPNPQMGISTVGEIADSVLMVNQDLYITGTRPLEDVDTPDALLELDETTFTVAGKQKMLMIELSRHVESLAASAAPGNTIHTGFQYLSRVDDERGTRSVYERLAEAGVDVHLYGVPDERPALPSSITLHGEDVAELRNSWFVVSTDCPDPLAGALLAEKSGRREWTGQWTFDADVARRVARYLEAEYGA